MDPATAVIIGFAAQTLLIAGLFWQVNSRMDKLATKDDVANLESRTSERFDEANRRTDERFDETNRRIDEANKRTDERFDEANRRTDERFNDLKEQIGQLARVVNDNRERLILIQGHLGIGLTVAPPAEAPQVEAPPERILASG